MGVTESGTFFPAGSDRILVFVLLNETFALGHSPDTVLIHSARATTSTLNTPDFCGFPLFFLFPLHSHVLYLLRQQPRGLEGGRGSVTRKVVSQGSPRSDKPSHATIRFLAM